MPLPCVTFNKINTCQWFKQNTYCLDDSHDASDRVKAFEKAIETKPLPLGIFYMNTNRKIFERSLPAYLDDKTPLYLRDLNVERLNELMAKRGEA